MRAWSSLLLCGAVLILPLRARAAAGLDVSPVLISLDAKTTNAILTLRNGGTEPVRLQATLVSWSQSDTGEMKLEPTKDLVFYPPLFTLAAGETRNLRVGSQRSLAGAREKSYRVLIKELPSAPRPAGASEVRVLTQLSLPIFVAPATGAVPRVQLAPPKLQDGKLSFVLRNDGNVRVRPQLVRAQLLDAKGAVLLERGFDAWYVLGGDVRAYGSDVPAEACRKAANVDVEVRFEDKTLHERAAVAPGACGK